MTPDIISAIDQATGCQQCGKLLGRSVSDDFCGEGCQQRWYTIRARVVKVEPPRVTMTVYTWDRASQATRAAAIELARMAELLRQRPRKGDAKPATNASGRTPE